MHPWIKFSDLSPSSRILYSHFPGYPGKQDKPSSPRVYVGWGLRKCFTSWTETLLLSLSQRTTAHLCVEDAIIYLCFPSHLNGIGYISSFFIGSYDNFLPMKSVVTPTNQPCRSFGILRLFLLKGMLNGVWFSINWYQSLRNHRSCWYVLYAKPSLSTDTFTQQYFLTKHATPKHQVKIWLRDVSYQNQFILGRFVPHWKI